MNELTINSNNLKMMSTQPLSLNESSKNNLKPKLDNMYLDIPVVSQQNNGNVLAHTFGNPSPKFNPNF